MKVPTDLFKKLSPEAQSEVLNLLRSIVSQKDTESDLHLINESK